jgi:hypothetical protein
MGLAQKTPLFVGNFNLQRLKKDDIKEVIREI